MSLFTPHYKPTLVTPADHFPLCPLSPTPLGPPPELVCIFPPEAGQSVDGVRRVEQQAPSRNEGAIRENIRINCKLAILRENKADNCIKVVIAH